MKQITNNEFMEFINKANAEEKRFDVSSMDTGGICANFYDCKIEVDTESGVGGGEICMFKTHASVSVDFDIVDNISEDGGTYYIELTNGSPCIQIDFHKGLEK